MKNRILFVVNAITIAGEPMGVMQLSAIAKQRGFETYICEARELNYLNKIKTIDPALIAISMMSSEYGFIKKVIEDIKERFEKIPIIVGGPHCTFAPDVIEQIPVEGICVGEGDYAFGEVLDRVKKGEGFDGIPNIYTKNVKSPIGHLIENLDELPFIDRSIIYDNSVWKYFKLRSFYSSRGCPNKCTYCFNHAYNNLYKGLGRIYRKRSVDNLIEEIEMVNAAYKTEFIRFSDDVFVLRADEWLEEFAKKYKKKIGIPFYCLVRADAVTDDMVTLLKDAGCSSICMSIESANIEIREHILHRKRQTNNEIVTVFNKFNQAGIHIYTNSMLGLPSSTIKDEIDTLDLYLDAKVKCGCFSICVPYLGTDIYNYAMEKGYFDTVYSFEDINKSFGQYSMFNCFTLKEKKIQKNIALLGPLVVGFPILRNLVVKYLIYFPENVIFFILHVISKNYLFSKYIVPLHYSFVDYFRLGSASLKNDIIMFIHGSKHKK